MLTELLSALNPTSGEIAAFFTAFKMVPPPILKALITSLDEQMLKKIALWTETFTQHLNDLGPDAISPEILKKSLEPGTDDDFFTVMYGTKFQGPTLDSQTLANASNAITKAIKAEDWQEAVWVGMTLSRILPA